VNNFLDNVENPSGCGDSLIVDAQYLPGQSEFPRQAPSRGHAIHVTAIAATADAIKKSLIRP